MTTLAAFIGGWELLLIAAVLGVLVGVPLLILAIVLLVVNRRKKMEDRDDLAVMAARRHEPTIPHEQFKAELNR